MRISYMRISYMSISYMSSHIVIQTILKGQYNN